MHTVPQQTCQPFPWSTARTVHVFDPHSHKEVWIPVHARHNSNSISLMFSTAAATRIGNSECSSQADYQNVTVFLSTNFKKQVV